VPVIIVGALIVTLGGGDAGSLRLLRAHATLSGPLITDREGAWTWRPCWGRRARSRRSTGCGYPGRSGQRDSIGRGVMGLRVKARPGGCRCGRI